jgi:hypothetical protein
MGAAKGAEGIGRCRRERKGSGSKKGSEAPLGRRRRGGKEHGKQTTRPRRKRTKKVKRMEHGQWNRTIGEKRKPRNSGMTEREYIRSGIGRSGGNERKEDKQ